MLAILTIFMFISLSLSCNAAKSEVLTELPSSNLKVPPMVKEESISTYIPSSASAADKLAVNIIYPHKPRYTEGAPIVVVVPGGEGASGLEFSMHAAQCGFCEVRFAFPDGSKSGFASSGAYDSRGSNCQQALRDVILFASGKLKDVRARTIKELLPVKVLTNNVGLLGWSNGGNILLVTLAKFQALLPVVSWLAFYESPLGSMFYPPALGGSQDMVINRHYRPGSSACGQPLVDYRKLAFQKDTQKSPGAHKKLGQAEIEGVVFLDENNNQVFDESFEFAFPYSTDIRLNKQIYPPAVAWALKRLGVLGKKWPDTIATPYESETYFHERDGSLYIREISKARPCLLILVFASQIDHLQRQSDHPHIALQYNAWLANKIAWVRLNPDPVYVGQIANMNVANFIDNKPNISLDASAMEDYLEPEGLVPDYVFMEAAIAELADRKQVGNFKDYLPRPIYNYVNAASVTTEK